MAGGQEGASAWRHAGQTRVRCGAGNPTAAGTARRGPARVRGGRSQGERPPEEATDHGTLSPPVGDGLDQRGIHVCVFHGGSGFVIA